MKHIDNPHNFDNKNLLSSLPLKSITIEQIQDREKKYINSNSIKNLTMFSHNTDDAEKLNKLYKKLYNKNDYDKIKSSSAKCPYCEIGISNDIDHVLPKGVTLYPEFSVFWHNLVPCCSDCNSAKGVNTFSFHPYKNNTTPDIYWLNSDFSFDSTSNMINFTFFPSGTCKQDIKDMFEKLKLSARYTTHASTEFSNNITSWKRFIDEGNPLDDLRQTCKDKTSPPATILIIAMYQGILSRFDDFIQMIPKCKI